MTIIYRQDPEYLKWAAERIGIASFRPDAKTLTITRGGQISGVIVYDTFSTVDCNISAASDGSRRWMSRELLAAIFKYPFLQLGLRRVTAIVATRNTTSLNYCKNMGFRKEGYCPHAMVDDDAWILGMLREDCRFIPRSNITGAIVPHKHEDDTCTKQPC